MELYFLKSAACLAILLLFYKLLLEKEDMHVFNRFYLLSAVLLSFLVPFISFTTYVEVPAENYITPITSSDVPPAAPLPAPGTPIWPTLLWILYGLGAFFFAIKFSLNLKELFFKIKRNPKIKGRHFTNVLLKENIVPHTFLDYIFLNKKKYEENNIPQEVFEHEQAHAAQKHSFDILFMELLQVVFWFHPLLYLTKNAIKLNHEFLADKMVLKKGTATAEYQQMLLAFSSGASHGSLAHPINYSFIKKRFTVMKTQTPKWAIWARSLLVLPVAALLLYGFSTKEVVERKVQDILQTEKVPLQEKATPEMIEEYNKLAKYYNSRPDSLVEKEEGDAEKLNRIYRLMTPEQRKKAEPFPAHMEIIEIVEDLPSQGISKEEYEEYNQLVNHYNRIGKLIIKQVDLEKILYLRARMTPLQLKNAAQLKFKLVPATPEMIEEYNKLAKYYNSLPEDQIVIRMKDLERMRYVHSLMTEEQKKKAAPLPAIYPPPPPPPPAPPVGEALPQVPEPPVPPAPETELEIPGPPPPPPAPVEHIKELAAEGARFFLSGEGEISAEQALKLVKNNKNISIKVTDYNSETTVHISNVKE